MSNEVINADVAAYQERLRAELLTLAKQTAAPSSNKISTRGKMFTLPDGQSHPGPMNVIVLDFVAVNSFYEGIYNPQVKKPPLCFAVGKELDSLKPSDKAPQPQNLSCAGCVRDAWGSGAGGRGKACKNTRRLIIVPPNFTDKTNPMTLYVSPTGLKQWDGYVRRLIIEHTARPIDVVTKISFDPNQAYPTLQFEFVEKVGDVMLAEKVRELARDIIWREPEVQQPAKAA